MTDEDKWQRAFDSVALMAAAKRHVSPEGWRRFEAWQRSHDYNLADDHDLYMAWLDADDEWREAVALARLEGKG